MIPGGAQYDTLHSTSDPTSMWSTVNLSEAMPGVVTPLGWSVWGPGCELATRRAFADIGVLPRAQSGIPARPEDRAMSIFFGRVAMRVDFWSQMGDRLPGTSGAALAEQFISSVPTEWNSRPERRYYPRAIVRFPLAAVRAVWLVRSVRGEIEQWWRDALPAISRANEQEARRWFLEGMNRFHECLYRQGMTTFFAVQPIYDLLRKLAAGSGVQAEALMGGYGGHEETAVINDLWACSRGRLDLQTFLERHGYHGPLEGEISSTVWRESPAPIVDLIERYAARDDTENPEAAETDRARDRRQREREFLAAIRPARRVVGRAIMRLGVSWVPLRGVAKVMFLQSLDVTRAAARRLGEHLVERGVLADRDDVFLLTASELCADPPTWSQELIESRRAEREGFEKIELPVSWHGRPTPASADPVCTETLTGIGSSPGTVEGTVRVVLDPSTTAVEPGDILVARTTDPSWASLMFLASALVVDIGSLLSHAAVVARELGIPCVMNTQHGTKVLRTGDRCLVNGDTGELKVLERAPGP